MALKKLINKQRIIIDDYKRGVGEVRDFDSFQNDIDINKETNFPVLIFVARYFGQQLGNKRAKKGSFLL